MPRYTFSCLCGHCEDVIVTINQRDIPRDCPDCYGKMQREFPVEAALNAQFFEPYYDPALGVDITGRRQRMHELKARNLIEAGDRVRGGINFDKHAPEHVKPEPPKGITHKVLDQKRRLEDQANKEFKLKIQQGKNPETVRMTDLPNAKDAIKKSGKKIF